MGRFVIGDSNNYLERSHGHLMRGVFQDPFTTAWVCSPKLGRTFGQLVVKGEKSSCSHRLLLSSDVRLSHGRVLTMQHLMAWSGCAFPLFEGVR